jgi:hypothetical protein
VKMNLMKTKILTCTIFWTLFFYWSNTIIGILYLLEGTDISPLQYFSITTCAYVVKQLVQLTSQDPVYLIYLTEATGKSSTPVCVLNYCCSIKYFWVQYYGWAGRGIRVCDWLCSDLFALMFLHIQSQYGRKWGS